MCGLKGLCLQIYMPIKVDLKVVRATLTVAPADVYYMLCLMAYTTVRVLSI